MTAAAGAITAIAGVLFAAPAAAQANYQSYPIGGRASGMGGAYTALSDDSAGAYYNPAGPAFAVGDSLSLSTNLYGMVGGRSLGAFGRGVDFTYSTVNIIPSASSSLSHLGRSTRERPSRWVFAFNVFAPQSLHGSQRSILNDGDTTLFQSVDETTLLVGPSLSFRISERLAVGVALYGSYHSATSRFDLTDTFATGVMGVTDFVQLTANQDASNIGLLASVGVRYEPVAGLLLGLSLRTPTIHVYGSGTAFTRFVLAPSSSGMLPAVSTVVDDVETRNVLPLRLALGVAWVRRGRFALAADLTMYLPIQYESLKSTRDPSLNQSVDRRLVLNGAIGIEYFVSSATPIHAGVFTDFSAAPVPDPRGSTEDHIDLVGATLGFGRSTEHTSSQFAVVGALGGAQVLGADLSSGSYQAFLARGSQWRVYAVLSGSFNY